MDSNFLVAEAQDDRGGKEGGKFASRFQRLANCCGKAKRNREGRASGVEDGLVPPESAVQSSVEEKEEVIAFVCKTLLIKTAQFSIICSYFFFVDNLPMAFERATVSWTLIPLVIFSSTFFYVRFKKNPPHYGVLLIMLLITTVSFAYLVAIGFSRYKYHVIGIPLSILFVYVAYVVLIPLFFCQLVTIEMSKRKYYLIPLWIVWIQNGILIVLTAVLPVKPASYGIANKFDMLCIFCLPTAFLSTVFAWFSVLQLRQIVEGQWFLVMFDSYYCDYLYAAMFMI